MNTIETTPNDLGLEYTFSTRRESICLELMNKLRKVPDFIPMSLISFEKARTDEEMVAIFRAVDEVCRYIADLELQVQFLKCTEEIAKCVSSALLEAGMTDMGFAITPIKKNDEYFTVQVMCSSFR